MCWPTRLQRLMLQRSFPTRSEATIPAWRLPFGVGWTRYSSTLPQLYLVYFSWVGLRPNLLWCNKDSIWESCNKFRCDWTLNLCINVLCVPAWSWDGTATQRLDRFRVGSLQSYGLFDDQDWFELHVLLLVLPCGALRVAQAWGIPAVGFAICSWIAYGGWREWQKHRPE